MFQRIITEQIEKVFFTGKIVLIVGPRQVGKTTLVRELLQKHATTEDIVEFRGDYTEDREVLSSESFSRLTSVIGSKKWIFIDEGQKIETIGNTLKILIDHYGKDRQIIVTGSSSFHLLNHTEEPLTGRKRVFTLFPISFEEIAKKNGTMESDRNLENLLVYGSYPAVLNLTDKEDKIDELLELTSSNLYRDILEFQEVKSSLVLTKLLKLLALQIGQEVSMHKMGQELGMDSRTVERYIDLLEKSFIVFRLPPYYTNKRKEVSKMQKIYFYDIGIRNTILGQFSSFHDRSDKGSIWENWIVSERLRYRTYHKILSTQHFWRGTNQQEVDLLENQNERLSAYEIKWKKHDKKNPPSGFKTLYPDANFQEIDHTNYLNFLL